MLLVAIMQAQGSSLQGVAVRQGTTEPIPRARLLLTKIDGSISDSRTVSTDAAGRFAFRGLAAGSYRLVAQHDAFVRADARIVTIAEGQAGDVLVPMVPTGAITGHVVDEYGEPVADVYVRAALKDATFETTTNDLGEYRLFGLPPGAYIVSAAPYLAPRIEMEMKLGNTPPTAMIVVPTPPDPNAPGAGQGLIFLAGVLKSGDFIPFMALRGESHATVYHPGTTDRAAAGPIEVSAGAVIGAINFTTAVQIKTK